MYQGSFSSGTLVHVLPHSKFQQRSIEIALCGIMIHILDLKLAHEPCSALISPFPKFCNIALPQN